MTKSESYANSRFLFLDINFERAQTIIFCVILYTITGKGRTKNESTSFFGRIHHTNLQFPAEICLAFRLKV